MTDRYYATARRIPDDVAAMCAVGGVNLKDLQMRWRKKRVSVMAQFYEVDRDTGRRIGRKSVWLGRGGMQGFSFCIVLFLVRAVYYLNFLVLLHMPNRAITIFC